MLRKTLAGVTALLLALGMAALTAMPVNAAQPDFICDSYAPDGTDKIDTEEDAEGNKPATVTVYAPAGFLIDYYCVKAGSPQSTDEPKQIIQVVPPAAVVIVDHPDKDSVSHYALHYVPECAVVSGIAATSDACTPPPPPDCETEVDEFSVAAVDDCDDLVTEVSGKATHQTCDSEKDEDVGIPVPGEIQLTVTDLAGVTDISYSRNGGPSTSVDLAGSLLITGLTPGTYDFVVTVAAGYAPVDDFSVEVKKTNDPACNKVVICHWNFGQGGGYVEIDVSIKSIITGPNGHDLHDQDVIPPFSYYDGEDQLQYPGKNWDPYSEGCLELTTYGPVTPEVVYTAPTCTQDGSYELISPAPEEGKSSTTVFWFVNDAPKEPGTYKAAAGTSVVIKVEANGPDYTLDDYTPERTYPEHYFAEPAGDCDLTTLALTGQEASSGPLALAGFLGLFGLAMVRMAARTARFRTEA